jgi:hypothetical protein
MDTILSRVWGSVTNNNGFWIGFINTSLTITFNHNQFITAHNKSSAKPLTAEDLLHSHSCSTTLLNSYSSHGIPRYIALGWTPRITPSSNNL